MGLLTRAFKSLLFHGSHQQQPEKLEMRVEKLKDYMIAEIESILTYVNEAEAEPTAVFQRINGLHARLMDQYAQLKQMCHKTHDLDTVMQRLDSVARDVRAEMEALYLILHQRMVMPEGRFHEFMFELNKSEEGIMYTYLRLYDIAKQRASTLMFMERHLAAVDSDWNNELTRIEAEYIAELGTACVQTMLQEMNHR
ncbi:hypothetical protein Ciccas_014426, partial [Cichlidogyrus casuarinus]